MSLRSFIQGGDPVTVPDANDGLSASLAFKQHQAELAVELNVELLAFAYRVLDGAITGPEAWAEYRAFERQVRDGQDNKLRVVRAALTEGDTN